MTTLLRAVIAVARLIGHAVAALHRATVVRYLNIRRRSNDQPEMNTQRRRLVAICTGTVVALVVIAVSSAGTTPTPSQPAAHAPTRVTAVGDDTDRVVAQPPAGRAPAELIGSPATVAAVVDGDTFKLTSGEKVRVLGIDSCEATTPGGRDATAMANQLLSRSQVTLAAEPGVDRDRYNRLLRYVTVNGVDFGEHMVRYDHTGVYEGHNDASAAYLAVLYGSDLQYATHPPAGRVCGDDQPPAPSYNAPNTSDDSSYLGRKAKGYVCRKTIFC